MKIQFNIQGKMTEDAGSAEVLNCQEALGTCMLKNMGDAPGDLFPSELR
jgi:hypothetical protein